MDNKTITILFSGPSDVSSEKDALCSVLQELSPTFQLLGFTVEPWRYEWNALPDIGPDAQSVVSRGIPESYDLFVGIIHSRFGTPTPRHGSGTAEEFHDAILRRNRTGRPGKILFYFASQMRPPGNADEREQQRFVLKFKKTYPGLNAVYSNKNKLVSQFKTHIMHYVVSEMKGKNAFVQGRDLLPWESLLAYAQKVDDSSRSSFSLSGSLETVISAMHQLWNIPGFLSEADEEILHVATLLFVRNRIFSTPDRKELPFLAREKAERAKRIALAAQGDIDPSFPDCILASFVKLAGPLFLQRSSLKHTQTCPISDGTLDHWMAWSTTEIQLYPGLVRYAFVGRDERSLSPIRKCQTYGRELAWMQTRSTLTAINATFAVAGSTLSLHPACPPPPEPVRKEADKIARFITEKLPSVARHLSGDTGAIDFGMLLPLPLGAISKSIVFPHFSPRTYRIELLGGENGENYLPISSVDPDTVTVDIERSHLSRGARYAWRLSRDDGFGDPTVVMKGSFVALDTTAFSCFEAIHMALDEPGLISEMISLGLANEVYTHLLPRLNSGKASGEERILAHRLLHDAWEWIQKHDRTSTRHDLYWKALEALQTAI